LKSLSIESPVELLSTRGQESTTKSRKRVPGTTTRYPLILLNFLNSLISVGLIGDYQGVRKNINLICEGLIEVCI